MFSIVLHNRPSIFEQILDLDFTLIDYKIVHLSFKKLLKNISRIDIVVYKFRFFDSISYDNMKLKNVLKCSFGYQSLFSDWWWI